MDNRGLLKICVLVAGVVLFSGCGGDSSSSSSTPTPTPTPSSTTGVVSHIVFTSADAAIIGINNYGLASTSTLTFTLVDDSGATVSGAAVTFSLNTTVGGITLSQATSTSDSSGLVTTTVSAGSVPTPVVVTAALTSDPTIYGQSNQLVIATGMPDQDHFSLSASTHNPEAWETDGVTVDLTVHASDHSGNPVPDGTTVYFQTEGGQVGSYCVIASGVCTATWTSSDRRPNNGRVTVTAITLGEEGFSDFNSNGVLDTGEWFNDMPDVVYDYNENDALDAGVAFTDTNLGIYYEEFLDFNGDGSEAADGLYNGTKCSATNTACSTQKSMDVRQNIVLTMSSHYVGSVTYDSGFPAYTPFTTLVITPGVGNSGYANMTVADINGNPMPAGTTIAITAPTGLTLNSPASYTVGNTSASGGTSHDISVTSTATPGTDVIKILITTPAGHATQISLPVTW